MSNETKANEVAETKAAEVTKVTDENAKVFVVEAGKWEHDFEDNKIVRNYKYVSEPMTLPDALADLAKQQSYPWNRIVVGDYEITATDREV